MKERGSAYNVYEHMYSYGLVHALIAVPSPQSPGLPYGLPRVATRRVSVQRVGCHGHERGDPKNDRAGRGKVTLFTNQSPLRRGSATRTAVGKLARGRSSFCIPSCAQAPMQLTATTAVGP